MIASFDWHTAALHGDFRPLVNGQPEEGWTLANRMVRAGAPAPGCTIQETQQVA